MIISPRPDASQDLEPLVRQALPSETVASAQDASQALTLFEQARYLGRTAAVFLLDFRRAPIDQLTDCVVELRQALRNSELIILVESTDSSTLAACLKLVGSTEAMTFLTAPVEGLLVVRTLRTVAERQRTGSHSKRVLRDSSEAIKGLELQVQELRTRLDIAKHAARHDHLTGSLNRTGFVEELATRLTRNRQMQNVIMIDLDRFKAVNDTLGHAAGDELVRKICTGMAAVLPSGAVLARLGGDEFGIVVETLSDLGMAELCTKILRLASQCRIIAGHEVQVSASIGIARQGSTHSEVELLRQADLALYAAKREGRNRFKVFDNDLDEATQHRLAIENGLERALNSGQLKMVYQPIVKADSRAVLGYEALVRWDSPDHGSISPNEFIPIAEETGLILDIGEWIARQTLRDCRKWNLPYVSINLSSRQFLRHNVGERILRYAADAHVAPNRIQIELTETAIIDDVERASYNLRILRDAGVRVALDDFGTGYSSLVYLKQFAIDCIKIDKSFVDNITHERQSAVIVASVAKLAASLSMSVIAEGVETEDQRTILMASGCTMLQGYHFGRPTPVNDLMPGHLGEPEY
ncbi:MAG: GGDEF domain-containing response regulator [Phenylobacterium zucineum]|nr:MAG: GGDEF domain-containing response regulator [Phenylobacterium zucineum]